MKQTPIILNTTNPSSSSPKDSLPHSPYVLHSVQRPRFYCPENLDLPALLRAKGLHRWQPHAWKLFYVLTVIYRARWNKSHAEGDFVPLSSKILLAVLGSRFYVPALATLRLIGVIETNNHYKVGEVCKGFRFTEEFRNAKFREVKGLDSNRFPERIFGEQIKDKNLTPEFQYMFSVLDRVTLAPSIEKFLAEFPAESDYQRDFYERSVEFIQQRDWTFCSDKRTGRVFTNVTNFPKSMRPFLRLDGKELAEVDIVNCQPFLLLGLYGNEPERKEFADAVARGTFYEMLDAELEIPFGTARRDELKAAVFGQVLFDRVRYKPTRLCKAFAARFPILFKKICTIKTPDYRRLALTLQSLEAEIIIAGVVREITNGPKFPVLTIHDSILTFPNLIPEVCGKIEKAFLAKLGAVPRLKIKTPPNEVEAIAA